VVKVEGPRGGGLCVREWPFYPVRLTLLGIVCSKGLFLYSAMDSVPRMSRAQKMDALSSMAGIAGRIGSDVRPFHN
jgi:hypothetical protein